MKVIVIDVQVIDKMKVILMKEKMKVIVIDGQVIDNSLLLSSYTVLSSLKYSH